MTPCANFKFEYPALEPPESLADVSYLRGMLDLYFGLMPSSVSPSTSKDIWTKYVKDVLARPGIRPNGVSTILRRTTFPLMPYSQTRELRWI